MWSAKFSSSYGRHFVRSGPFAVVAASAAVMTKGFSAMPSGSDISCAECEESSSSSSAKSNNDPRRQAHLLQKIKTLRQAESGIPQSSPQTLRRVSTREQLSKIRANEKEMLLRWERDEDGWRDLPARAWPAYQPNPKELEEIKVQVKNNHCTNSNNNETSDLCRTLLFHMATSLVFYNIDPEAGYHQFKELAEKGHVDSMVACGVILIEGMGVPPQEKKGVEWLQKAVANHSAQGCYELGTVLYTGIDGIIEEDPEAAFKLFEEAADHGHPAGMYMVAECLVDGEGTERNVARAVPLFYQAADLGHRFSRQRIRELLSKFDYH